MMAFCMPLMMMAAVKSGGLLRRTSWDDYLSGTPEWEVVLDMDALVDPESDPGSSDADTVHLKTDFRMAENIPKHNKG